MHLHEKRLKAVSIVIVGSCNGNPWVHTHLGKFILRKEDTKYVPYLIYEEQLPIEVSIVHDQYVLEINQWSSNHGLRLLLNITGDIHTFVTGLHPYDSGSSGPLVFGATEMIEILNIVI
jgi:hypothetical protein